ncbi:MAG: FliM/FliN family flagellar motor switch protein [Vampirovibrionales bacterium]|nr:FliM/FliN family flagellar motor switch protein [Vampirovibrionales bacterium]
MLAPGASSPYSGYPAANTGAQGNSPAVCGPGQARQALPQAFLAHIARHVSTVSPALEALLGSFWGKGIRLRFFTASPKVHYFWRQDDFYVSQAGNNIHIRLSDNGCALLLDKALGKRDESAAAQTFSFSALTGFEASLLTTFSKEALTFLAKNLIQPASLKPSAPNTPQKAITAENPLIHLIWVLAGETETNEKQIAFASDTQNEAGKLILSLPLAALKIPPLNALSPAAEEHFPEQWVYHAMSTVTLGIGSGKLPVSAIEEIEPDDIIVLENSSVSQLSLINPLNQEQAGFPVKLLHPKAITRSDIKLDLDAPKNDARNPQEAHPMSPNATNTMDSDSRQALLDSLMIDVGAQFTPVKMPLHQIKQMSEGLIVEVGDLVHNEVLLTVEGKPLALGELVIVGDKFGVRVVAVTPDGESMPVREVKAYPAAMPESMKAPVKEGKEAVKEAATKQEAPSKGETPPKSEASKPQPAENAPAPAAPAPAAEAPAELNDDFLNDDFDDDDDW